MIAPASLLIDLHSAGIAYSMPTLVGYPYADTPHGRARARQRWPLAAMWCRGHPPDPNAGGRTISAAEALASHGSTPRRPAVVAHLPEDVDCYRTGVLNS